MTCKWALLSGASGKLFVFLSNVSKLDGYSLLSFFTLLPGTDAWCPEAQQTSVIIRWQVWKQKATLLGGQERNIERSLVPDSITEQLSHPWAALHLSLYNTSVYLFKPLFVVFSIPCNLLYQAVLSCFPLSSFPKSSACLLLLHSCPTLCNFMDCSLPGSSVLGDSPGKNTGVGCHALLQGIFPAPEGNSGPLHCKRILYCLSHQGENNCNLGDFPVCLEVKTLCSQCRGHRFDPWLGNQYSTCLSHKIKLPFL